MHYVLVSACLLGKKVRYDGQALTVADEILEQWRAEKRIVSVCPEVEAGMSTPRPPAEIIAGDGASVLAGETQVWENEGRDVTADFIEGASIALERCRRFGIKVAVLAESSPSCGSTTIYDGHFAGHKVAGMGVTAALLRQHGVRVFSQHDIARAHLALLDA
ncbi:DUF523 domain-containing protein [Halomonas sp. HMF6819]|uniref:DUF523 domain-containing protein n=1 Tax=Halomonas sp. HMF6819 TaxID=3373085 RepID=UPI0037B8E2DE